MTKLSKPIVVFLDDEPSQVREVFLKWFDIVEPVNTTTEHFCITNISRDGKKLDKYAVRTSDIHPHFYSRDCLNDAMVYGDSDFIGDDVFESINWLNISPDGEILPAQVIGWGMAATEYMKMKYAAGQTLNTSTSAVTQVYLFLMGAFQSLAL